MGVKNFLFGSKGRKVWFGVSLSLIVVAGALTISVFASPSLDSIVSTVVGGPRAVYKGGSSARFPSDYASKSATLEAANKLNEKVCEEGFVLLKNDGTLPLNKGAKISVFGKNSVNLAYGGSGSGGASSSDFKTIDNSLSDAGFVTNPVLRSFYEDDSASGAKRAGNSTNLDSGEAVSIATGETAQAKYTQKVKDSYLDYSDLALIVITRVGGEGFDLPLHQGTTEGAASPDDHYLQLDQNERDLVSAVTAAGFKKVAVVFNIPSSFEAPFVVDNEKINAAIWMGFPGGSGAMALGKILDGEVNPSGRSVDTWARDFKENPTFCNFGSGPDGDGKGDAYDMTGFSSSNPYYFVDYEEGVYVGYKYYETRGASDGAAWYQNQVVFPFGYGLSYTSFTWEMADDASLRNQTIEKGKTYQVSVKVTNTGKVAGKDVVELYGHAPYFDGEIEKPEVTLLDFKKTKLLEPGASDTVSFTFDPYLLASYDGGYDGGTEMFDLNGNGFLGYELDQGDYSLYFAKNAHERVLDVPFSSPNIQYDKDPTTGNEVKNRFSGIKSDNNLNCDAHLINGTLSRADWEGTFPEKPSAEDKKMSAALLATLQDTATNNPTDYSKSKMPTLGTVTHRGSNGEPEALKLAQMASLSYDDPLWDSLLDQLSYSDLSALFEQGGFKTASIDSVGKPKTNDTDGPAGFVNFMSTDGTYWGTCYYCCETVMASTYNQDLVNEVGAMIGNEGIWGSNGKGNGLPYSGWYAPGVNLHRSPFGGRNSEYFSEDGILNGKMAAAEIRGCQSKGVYAYLKHYALNEQETHRSVTGDCSWVSEQAMREVFLRPFELAVKEGGTRAIMSSFNRIGAKWTGGDYRLLTEILRQEWGFRGTVICDFNTCPHMNTRQMAYAGGDLDLVALLPTAFSDSSNAGDVIILRQAAKNILYTVANSNAMNGEIDHYAMAYWKIALLSVDGGILLITALWGFLLHRPSHQKEA